MSPKLFDTTLIRERVSFNASLFRDPSATVRGIFASARDITRQKQLRGSQFYTRSLIEPKIDALMTTDPSGIITDVNRQMEALTGCTRYSTDRAAYSTASGSNLVLRQKPAREENHGQDTGRG